MDTVVREVDGKLLKLCLQVFQEDLSLLAGSNVVFFKHAQEKVSDKIFYG